MPYIVDFENVSTIGLVVLYVSPDSTCWSVLDPPVFRGSRCRPGAVISAATAHGYAKSSVSGKLSWDPTGVSLDGVAVAALAIAVLGVLCMSSEYSSGMIRTSLIAVPKRGRVLAAKSLVFAVVTFVVGEVTSFAAFFAGQALISGHAPHAALGDPGVARAVAGAGLYLTVLAVLSVAAGALLRHPAAAIACLVAVLFVLPGIAQALPDSWRNPVTEFWPTQAGGQLTSPKLRPIR